MKSNFNLKYYYFTKKTIVIIILNFLKNKTVKKKI